MPSAGDVISTIAGVGMAVGPPLVYVDQAVSIIRKKDSSGFSHDVCGVLLIANIIRIFFWLGNRFETPLLVQSILLIVSQLLLLSICLHYRPSPTSPTADYAPLSPMLDAPDSSSSPDYPSHHRPSSPSGHARIGNLPRSRKSRFTEMFTSRPFGFWQWAALGQYLEFLAGLIVVLGVSQVVFGRWKWYIDALGFIALFIESTLPIPQFIANYKRKTCYGFRSSTLAGWVFGDSFKTVYFFIRNAPLQFKVTAILTVCWDCAVLAQRVIYKAEPPISARGEDEEEARGLRLGGAAPG
ncbi:uncharacterized protein MKK02DRAFT_33885 [Dioszegia hungarica]|uniref:PQ-loop repeat-containing protein 1 n=1 Tax=Dioszegia hungarica TaxID=4972 RepID=A0AA38LWK4_9TREE|nr:uncharacterized protein MKK02DRAFT_33885 [Dioszegia hungarica]KAI9636764.1 hypothetical protein MKK02DRAFT_33885 [Dioszegia hungarica]